MRTFRLKPLPALAAVLLLLSGCGAPEPPATEAQAPAASANPGEGAELRDAIQQPIDKAKATEAETLKAAEEQKQRIEDAGG